MEAQPLQPHDPKPSTRVSVVRNTALLVAGKVLSMPILVLHQAMLARFLGAQDFGYYFVAQAYAAFGTVLITWGQANTLPAAIARDRAKAPELLGSALVLRACLAAVVAGIFFVACLALTGDGHFRLVLAFVFGYTTFIGVTGTLQDAVRGFERTDVDALLQVLGPLLGFGGGFAVLVLGGRIPGLMICGVAINLMLTQIVRRAIAGSGVRALRWSRDSVRLLAVEGWPFIFYGFAMTLQPAVDAAFLSKLAPAQVIGWHAAATKLVGILVFPTGALMASLYPTLCRLHVEDMHAFRRTTASALRVSTLVAVPVALGCALFPDLGVRLFSRGAYGPAQQNVRVLSVFVFALYFTMPLGSALLAARRQRAWTIVQSLCVVVSIVLDPLLVPWFQRRSGNGGLGICASTTISECAMVAGAIYLAPRGVFDRGTLRSLGLASVSGAAMVLVGRALSSTTSWLAAPVSLAAYCGCLLLTGAVSLSELASVRAMFSRRFAR
jgi:O-antigen/teichoic acid export membrane protein